MKTHKYLIATGTIALTLMAVSPAFADEGAGNGLHLNFGGMVSALAHRLSGDASTTAKDGLGMQVSALAQEKNDSNSDNEDKKSDHQKNATITVSVTGTVTAVNGSSMTVTGKKGALYSVNVTTATLINGSTDLSAFGKIQIGDRVEVKGMLVGSAISATKITNGQEKKREALVRMNGMRAGVVTSVADGLITVNRFGIGTTSVVTTASTFFAANGSATTSAAAHVGSRILAFGPTTTGTSDSITASVVVILDSGLNFLKNLFR